MKARLADPALRSAVEAAVRRRIRGDDAEDVVQATLADLLSAEQLPEDPEEFRRFVFGVARNKVFDHFRRQKRETEGLDENELAGPEPPLSARDILRWAEGELPDSESKNTLEWMLREGDGEKLEHIARDARVPAPRVRKRVSRLRKFLRERWQAELLLAGLVALLAAFGALYWYLKHVDPADLVRPEPPPLLPSAPRVLPTSRPAGSVAPMPNVLPTPSPPVSAVPAPSALPKNAPQAKRARPQPKATDDSLSEPAPQTNAPQTTPQQAAPQQAAPQQAAPQQAKSKTPPAQDAKPGVDSWLNGTKGGAKK